MSESNFELGAILKHVPDSRNHNIEPHFEFAEASLARNMKIKKLLFLCANFI